MFKYQLTRLIFMPYFSIFFAATPLNSSIGYKGVQNDEKNNLERCLGLS